ncbi:MAG: hypothetical protein WB615_11035 [Candidatus Tumulicola sp.]
MMPRSITAVLLPLLTACSFASNASSSYAPGPPAVEFAGGRTALVYVSDRTNNLIDVFDRGGHLQYTITSGLNEPAGLFVDAQHNLWVANPGANDVLVFPRGSMDPARTLNDTNQPNDVAVCGDGTAFVADSLNQGGVAVYPPGRKAPTRRLIAQQSGAGGIESYVTCDEAGNIFATGFIGASPFPATTGWRRGRESGYYLFPQQAWSSSGIKATAAGTLLIATYAKSKPAVVEFTKAGKRTGSSIHTGSDLWSDIALDAGQTVVFGVDTPGDAAIARKFPGGALQHAYTNANLVQPVGVAVDPGSN